MMGKPKVVILCGGMGTRMKEITEVIPKPMVKVGGMPLLWHIMKCYSHHGFNDFVLCLGYKSEVIKEFFLNYKYYINDFTLNLQPKTERITHHTPSVEDWRITFADTGYNSETGARIKKIQKYIDTDYFLVTYGDGLSNVNIPALIEQHLRKGKIATVTALNPRSKFGTIAVDENEIVSYFKEKPLTKELVSGGFFVFDKKIFNYLNESSGCCMEREPFENLAKDKEIAIFKHDGFWACMDTYKDLKVLEEYWELGNAPWKVWTEET